MPWDCRKLCMFDTRIAAGRGQQIPARNISIFIAKGRQCDATICVRHILVYNQGRKGHEAKFFQGLILYSKGGISSNVGTSSCWVSMRASGTPCISRDRWVKTWLDNLTAGPGNPRRSELDYISIISNLPNWGLDPKCSFNRTVFFLIRLRLGFFFENGFFFGQHWLTEFDLAKLHRRHRAWQNVRGDDGSSLAQQQQPPDATATSTTLRSATWTRLSICGSDPIFSSVGLAIGIPAWWDLLIASCHAHMLMLLSVVDGWIFH